MPCAPHVSLLLGLGVTAILAAGCESKARPAADAVGGTGGALAVVHVDGVDKAYVYYGLSTPEHAQVAVADVGLAGNGVAGAPARIGLVDVGPGDFGMSLAANDRHVVAASIVNPVVHFLDPLADTVRGSLALDASYQKYAVSDREAYVISVAIDSPSHRAFLSVWNGVAVVDLLSRQVVSRVLAAPTENLAYDRVRGWLLAPFYDCALATSPPPPTCGDYQSPAGDPMLSGLNLIEVATGRVFTFQNPAAPDPAAPLGVHPDGVGVDPVTGLAAVAPEDTSLLYGLDLSQAVLNPTTKSFTAPSFSVESPPAGATPSGTLTGITVSEGGSWVFTLREASSEVGIVARAALTSGTGPVLVGAMPDLPGATPWQNRGDPHGVTYARVGGRDVALLVNLDQTWLARIDLATLAALPHAGATGWTATELAPAVTYLDLTRAR